MRQTLDLINVFSHCRTKLPLFCLVTLTDQNYCSLKELNVFKYLICSCSFSKEFPVNIKFCLEGMEESGSEGLDELIFAQRNAFFKDVDYICISDNYWLGKSKPCITYGLRGICYYFIEVSSEIHGQASIKLNFVLENAGFPSH